ncbi:MAG TPA: GDP-mannose 4,6-dehydratase [Candidatus Bathyarchaeia archaeon]
MKYKNLLVVGGAGFVGSHVVDALVKHGAEKIVVVDNMFLGKPENLNEATQKGDIIVYKEDARYLTALENIIEREKPEAVYNLAVKCLPYGFIDPEGAFMTGVEIAHNLANLLRKKKFERLLHFSSSEAYGTAVHVPMDESHPLDPNSPYGAGKAAADLLLLSYYKLYNLEISVLRPFNFYGERQNMEAYAAVIPVTIWRILNGEKPILEGDGLQSRDFTYVKDGAELAVKMMDCDKALGKVVNIGQGDEIDIKTTISMICDKLDYPFAKVERKPARPSDVRRLHADITLAKKMLGYSPKTSFNEGLELTIDWFRSKMECKNARS